MPLPSPSNGESRSDFLSRCIRDPKVQSEAENNDQAVAICSTIWDQRNMTPQEKLLQAIRSRSSKQTEFGYGILTADRHVQNMVDSCGLPFCQEHAFLKTMSFADALEKAKSTLVYSNEDMRAEKDMMGIVQPQVDIELPKNTLMTFKHVLTTPRKDRDGDILRTEGADPDPNMLLLWQHTHTLPIGKMLMVSEHNAQKLAMVTAIIDINELAHDAAVMVDNDMARFSHGFRALEFEQLKDENGKAIGGFDIKRFEIMEESLVSVPSNVDAQVEERMLDLIEGGRMTSDLMKHYGKTLRERKPLQVAITTKLGDYSVTTEVSGKDAVDAAQKIHREVLDEDGKKSGAEETGGEKPTSEKTDDDSGTKEAEGREEEATSVEEVKTLTLTGSFYWIEQEIRQKAKEYLVSKAISIEEGEFVYVAGTFADSAILCIEKPEFGVPDEFRYFQVSWKKDGDSISLEGEPKQVDLVTTTEIRERSPSFESKGIDGTPQKEEITGQRAMEIFLGVSTRQQRHTMAALIKGIQKIEKQKNTTAAYSKLRNRT